MEVELKSRKLAPGSAVILLKMPGGDWSALDEDQRT